MDSVLIKHVGKKKPLPAETYSEKLEAFKNGHRRIAEKITVLDKTVAQNHVNSMLQQHRVAWYAEHERLESLSTSLERSLHDHLRAFVTQCDPSIDDQHNVDALTRIDDIMIDMEGADEERIEFVKEIAEPVTTVLQHMNRVRNDQSRQLSNRARMQNDCMDHISSIKASLAQVNAQLEADYASAMESVIETRAPLHAHAADDEEMRRNPWMLHNGEVVRFLELPCRDEETRNARFEAYHRLISTYDDAIRTSERTAHSPSPLPFDQATVAPNGKPSRPVAPKKITEADRFRIRKIMDEYASISTHKWRLCMDRIKLEIPGLRKDDISYYTRQLTARGHHAAQHASHQQRHIDELAVFIAETVDMFRTAEVEIWRASVAELDGAHRDEAAAQTHARLDRWRTERDSARWVAEEGALHCKRIWEEEQRIAQDKAQAARAAHMELIEQYQHAKHAQLLQQMSQGEHLRHAYAEEVMERSKHNVARIHHRDSLYVQKLADKTAEADQQKQEQLALQNRLDRLRASVAPNVAVDRERACGDTEAFRRFKLAEKEHSPLYKVDGYTVHDMFKDQRLKLSLALHERGLAHNSYARDMLKSMVLEPVRADQKSAIRLG
ncbi:hypothetical protein PhCBS80983_g06100 [Powellomyces hirtus]|uniref:Uncharacterized protein n=1 Tax=Powellomyces hirtus TaxID=109895 RepID=A0A507DRQ4_9FUNG|nr:hypothetical protein PhCBS80983_g06100 [Powellomyces hirtus]